MANIIVNFEFSRFFFLKLYDSLTLRSVWGLVYMIQYYKLNLTDMRLTAYEISFSIYILLKAQTTNQKSLRYKSIHSNM